jgi:hypothetical protein
VPEKILYTTLGSRVLYSQRYTSNPIGDCLGTYLAPEMLYIVQFCIREASPSHPFWYTSYHFTTTLTTDIDMCKFTAPNDSLPHHTTIAPYNHTTPICVNFVHHRRGSCVCNVSCHINQRVTSSRLRQLLHVQVCTAGL